MLNSWTIRGLRRVAPWRPAPQARAQGISVLPQDSAAATQTAIEKNDDLVQMTGAIVAAYLSKNPVKDDELLMLIQSVHATLAEIDGMDEASSSHSESKPYAP